MYKVGAILLAAGLSSRMGALNKLLLPVNGEPLIRGVARTYLNVIDGPLTVVTGFEADIVRDALHGLTVEFAHNDQFADGQPGSVASGLRKAPEAELLIIGLGDQPLLTRKNLVELTEAHKSGDAERITVPVHAGRRGNPVIVPRSLRGRLTENPEHPGCMRFTRDHPEHVRTADLAATGFYADVDTPEDFIRIVQTGWETLS
jgi:molybdenum cofactor cytidylyltransferase